MRIFWGRGITGALSSGRKYQLLLCANKRPLNMDSRFPAPKLDLMLPKDAFNGKVAFITGGGTGLGRGMAEVFSQLGASVAIAARRLPVLEKTAEEISKETGNKVLALQLDVRDPDSVKEAVGKCVDTFGLPNIIVNNAAGNFISPFERVSPKGFKTVVDIVLNGTANVTLEIGRRLIAAKQGGCFLAISTPYARTGTGYVVPSACAKAGIDALTKSLAYEWGKYGLRFNAIAPGPIKTEGAFSRLDPTGEFEEKLKTINPTQRLGEIRELANLASYMVSDYASWLNGEIVSFDGGECRAVGSVFNNLSQVTEDQWDLLEQMIRSANKKSKSKL